MTGMQIAPDGFVWCGKKRDLSLYLTHIRAHNDDEPALYIRNEHRKVEGRNPVTGGVKDGCPAYIIPLRDFWIFRPEDKDLGRNHSNEEAVWRLGNAAQALYGMDAPEYRNKILDAVLDFADDVKNLAPPVELSREQWLGQMKRAGITLKVNGEELA